MRDIILAVPALRPEDQVPRLCVGAGQVLALGGVVLRLRGTRNLHVERLADGVLRQTYGAARVSLFCADEEERGGEGEVKEEEGERCLHYLSNQSHPWRALCSRHRPRRKGDPFLLGRPRRCRRRSRSRQKEEGEEVWRL